MYDDQVLMKISEPNDIDPMYGLTATTNAAWKCVTRRSRKLRE